MCFAYGVSVESVDVKVDARREVTRCAFRAASRGHFPALRDSFFRVITHQKNKIDARDCVLLTQHVAFSWGFFFLGDSYTRWV